MKIHFSLRVLSIVLPLTLLGPIAYAQGVAVVSGASFLPTPQTSGGIASAFGINLSIGTASATTNPLPLTLSGTTLALKDGTGIDHEVRLFYVSPKQINFLVPPGSSTGPALLTIRRSDGNSQNTTFNVTTLQPSIFAANFNGRGVAAAETVRVAPDETQVTEPTARFVQIDTGSSEFFPRPIDFGPQGYRLFLVLYGTGFSIGGNALASVGGILLPTVYVGPQGIFAGLDQATIELPRTLQGRGLVDVTLSVDGITSNVVQIEFR